MMPATFGDALARIESARTPVELFAVADPAGARSAYRTLARLVHPDHAPSDAADKAQAAFAKLAGLYAALPGYPVAAPPLPAFSVTTKTRTYTSRERLAEGDLANLIVMAFDEDGDESTAILKIIRDAANTDLLSAEATALRTIARDGDLDYRAFFPELLDTLTYRDTATGLERGANVLRDMPTFVTLADVKAAYPNGLDARDVAWMWRRLLTALGAAHGAGVVHGAVTPEHIMIEPDAHGLVLVDWCYSVKTDAAGAYPALAAIVPAHRALYPPEVIARNPVSPASDLFMASKVMEGLFDAATPRAIRAFVAGCMQERVTTRPDDAWSLLHELDGLLVRLYGPHQFRPFAMPGATKP